jgi:hypothetical protein
MGLKDMRCDDEKWMELVQDENDYYSAFGINIQVLLLQH